MQHVADKTVTASNHDHKPSGETDEQLKVVWNSIQNNAPQNQAAATPDNDEQQDSEYVTQSGGSDFDGLGTSKHDDALPVNSDLDGYLSTTSKSPQPNTDDIYVAPLDIDTNEHKKVTKKYSDNRIVRQFQLAMDVEPIRPYIDVAFGKREHVLTSVLLFRSVTSIYLAAIIDIVSDLMLTIKVSTRDNCIKTAYTEDDKSATFQTCVIFLWISSLCAIINTGFFKYLYVLNAKNKYNLSFWNAFKYVAVYTQLKTTISTAQCCNRYQWARQFVIFTEDLIQLIIGISFANALRKADFITWFSVYTSLLCFVWVMTSSIFWLFRDCLKSCCAHCQCFSDPSKCRGVRNCLRCGCFLPAMVVAVMAIFHIDQNHYQWNRGYQVADIEYHIDYVSVSLEGHTMEHIYFMENITVAHHYGTGSGLAAEWRDVQCVDYLRQQFDGVDLPPLMEYPMLCVEIVDKQLLVRIVYDGGHYNDDGHRVIMVTRDKMGFAQNTAYTLDEQDFHVCSPQEDCKDEFGISIAANTVNVSIHLEYEWLYLLNCS